MMNEYEKMLKQEWYDANYDSHLIELRKKFKIYVLNITKHVLRI